MQLTNYFKTVGEEKNMIFSPYGINTLLALTSAGGKKATKKQMLDVLSLNEENNFHAGHGLAADQLLSLQREGVQLTLANNVFLQKGYHIDENFLAIASKYYKARPQELDFANEPKAR